MPFGYNIGSLTLEHRSDTPRSRRVGLLFTYAELLTNLFVFVVLWKAIGGYTLLLIALLFGAKVGVLFLGRPICCSTTTLLLYAAANCVVFVPVPRPLYWHHMMHTTVAAPAVPTVVTKYLTSSQIGSEVPADTAVGATANLSGQPRTTVEDASLNVRGSADFFLAAQPPFSGAGLTLPHPSDGASNDVEQQLPVPGYGKSDSGAVLQFSVAGSPERSSESAPPQVADKAGASLRLPRGVSTCLRRLHIEGLVVRCVLAVMQSRYLWLLLLWASTPGLWTVAWLAAFAASPCPLPVMPSVSASSASLYDDDAPELHIQLGSCGAKMLGVCGHLTCYGRFPEQVVLLCCFCMAVAFSSFVYLALAAFRPVRARTQKPSNN
jgi:hypothetical protein